MSIISIARQVAAAVAISVAISSMASAAVYPPSRQLPAQVITEFKASPSTLLQQYSAGGASLITRVRDLAASDPTTLPGLIALLKDPATTKDQMRAIVTGLAQVARMAAQQDQAFANEIQTQIAATGNSDVIAAYQAAAGDTLIAATGGGGAGGGGTGTGGSTGTSGFVFGGNNGGTFFSGSSFTSNSGYGLTSASVGGTTNSVSSR